MSKTYFMLMLSLFSFIGLGCVHSFVHLFSDSDLVINIALEEESDSKTNEELEVKNEKEVVNYAFVIQEQNHAMTLVYQNHLFSLNDPIIEVITPPPEA